MIPGQIEQLRDKGYVVVPRFVPADALRRLNETARAQLAARAEPLEFEADLQYPGAPPSRAAAGGETVRRLLDAYGRDCAFAQWGTAPALREWMEAYFGEPVLMSRTHHNCLMTKHPLYGSLTNWHRDIRYWSFEREDLVSVWFALGEERVENGALWFVPGSNRMVFDAGRFDEARFFRSDRADNAGLLRAAESPQPRAGRRGVLPLQYPALGRQESNRYGEILTGLHLPRPQQRPAGGHAVGVEARSRTAAPAACLTAAPGRCYPARESLQRMRTVAKIPFGVGPQFPQVVVLVGATGDLARRKLLPGMFHLSRAGFIPGCRIIGLSLDELDTDGFRKIARDALTEFSTRRWSKPTGLRLQPTCNTYPWRPAPRFSRRRSSRRSAPSTVKAAGCTT